MAWSWMDVESEWISPSQKDLTPQPLGSTWDGPRTVEVVLVGLDAIHVTTTVDTIADTTEAATIAMTTGTTADPTEGDLRLHTTEDLTGPGPDHGLILPVDIDRLCQAEAPSLP